MAKAQHRGNGEIKKQYSLGLTPTAVKGLDEIAAALNVSRSHLVEMIGLKEIPVPVLSEQSLGESLSS